MHFFSIIVVPIMKLDGETNQETLIWSAQSQVLQVYQQYEGRKCVAV